MELVIGKSYFNRGYVQKREVIIKAIYDDKVVYHDLHKDADAIMFLEDFKETHTLDLNAAKREQIAIHIAEIDRQKKVLEERLHVQLKALKKLNEEDAKINATR